MFSNKYKVAYLVVFYILLSTTSFSQDNWSWLNPKPMGYNIFGSALVPSTSTVVAVGEKGVIARSSNTGSSWDLLHWDSGQILRSVHFPSPNVGYACGDNSVLLKTTNAGDTWVAVSTIDIPGNYQQVQFISENTGFLLDKVNHILYKTVNGGIEWEVFLSYGLAGSYNSFQMIDEDNGWVATSSGKVIKKVLGNFTAITVTDTFAIDLVRFYDAQNGVTLTGGSSYYTTDGGLNWNFGSSGFLFSPRMVEYSSANKITAVASGETIAISTDAGRNWSTITSGASNLNTILFLNSLDGIINGMNGVQYRTIDGGATWENTSRLISAVQLNSVSFTSENTGYVAGGAGKLFRTLDAGATWTSQTLITGESIFKLFFLNSSTGFATSQTKLFKTGNSGTNWSSINLAGFQDIHFKDASNGIVCGTSANKIATTTNGGTIWIYNGDDDLTQNLYALSCLPDNQTVIAVGDAGTVVRSINYGTDWSNIASGTSEQLNSVHFANASFGWACGNNGTIIHSTDGGLTWSPQTSGTTEHLQSIKFYDASSGIAVGYNGVMLKTNNGGTIWTKYETVAPYSLYEVAILSASSAVVVGANGTIIKGENLPLPVELTSFTARVSGSTVTLLWETKTEIDNYGFEIERKTATSTWQKIGFVEGHSTTNSPKYYNFTDSPRGNGKFQYRLKQIDNDGAFEYSSVVEVDLSGLLPMEIEIKNFPNPFNPETNINIRVPETSETTIELYDLTGEKIATLDELVIEKGSIYALKLDGSMLPSGIYIIHVTAGKHRNSHKIMLMK